MTNLRRITPTLILLAVTLFHHSASAYVLRGPHILYLMLDKIGYVNSLAVTQKLTFYPMEIDDEKTQVEEHLKYEFPKHFRSDSQNDHGSRIHVISGDQALTIINGKITDSPETEIHHYSDILFYRSRVLLENQLKMLDIDISVSSLGRFNGKIYYIVGAKYPDISPPQLWINKETFQPARLIIKNSADPKSFLEFRYLLWQKNGRIRFPMQTNIYWGDRLIRNIKVDRFEVNPKFDDDIFNITRLQSFYPEALPVEDASEKPDDLKDVQQSIENFKKIFD